MKFVEHLKRQISWSRANFGPHERREGVIDHIKKELVEVETAITVMHRINEWTDVAILGVDGLWRSIAAVYPELTTDQIAERVVAEILAKQNQNEKRDWPDWRTSEPDKAIEHVKGA